MYDRWYSHGSLGLDPDDRVTVSRSSDWKNGSGLLIPRPLTATSLRRSSDKVITFIAGLHAMYERSESDRYPCQSKLLPIPTVRCAVRIGSMNNHYPRTVAECVVPGRKYKPAVLRAVRAFAKSKPFMGTIAERQEKFKALNTAIAAAYNVLEPRLVFETDESQDSGSSCFVPASKTIILRGRLSVVTLLHEIGHSVFGRSERKACRWSLNLFRRCFPRSWARLQFEGHVVRAEGREG